MYDPKAKEKDLIKHILKRINKNYSFTYPRVSFLFDFPIPESTPKKLKALMETGLIKHDKKPDCDNLVKLYLDCMTQIIIDDDKNVSLGSVNKLYNKEPKTTILIRSTNQKIDPWEVDEEFSLFEESSKSMSSETASQHDFYTASVRAPHICTDNLIPLLLNPS